MSNKISDSINEAFNESKKQVENLFEKKGAVKEFGNIAADKARETADKARAKATKTATAGTEAFGKISEKMHRENLVRMAESVRDEVKHTLFANTMSEIARLKDDTDELRRKMSDMQKAYDKKINELQSRVKKQTKPAAKAPAKKTATAKAPAKKAPAKKVPAKKVPAKKA